MASYAGDTGLFDVIIAGAGPAGSILAQSLAGKGMSVCVVEKEELPRYKPCAGGLQVKAASLLDFDFFEVVEDITYCISFTFDFQDGFSRSSDKPLVYMVSRDRFDLLLAERAVAAGARLLQGERVTDVDAGGDLVTVTTGKGRSLRGRVVAGADGVRSIVSKRLGLDRGFRYDVAIEGEIPIDRPLLEEKYKGEVRIDLGAVPGGYCWVFPKSDRLSVGIAAPARDARQLRKHYAGWLAFNDIPAENGGRTRGHQLRFRTSGKLPISSGRALLVGDAAGLADILTGEGLPYAIRSAQIAARVIGNALADGRDDPDALRAYDVAVNEELGEELALAHLLFRAFSLMPHRIYTLMKRERPWRFMAGILRGERSYGSLEEEYGSLSLLLRSLGMLGQ